MAKDISERRLPPWHFWLVIGGLLSGVGIAVVIYAIVMMRTADAAKNWPTATATILESVVKVRESTNSEGWTVRKYRPHVTYRFEIGGEGVISEAISPARRSRQFSRWSRSWASKIVGKYPKGTSTTVYYNPQKPLETYLETSAGFTPYLFLSVGVALIGGGCAARPLFRFLFSESSDSLRSRRRRRRGYLTDE